MAVTPNSIITAQGIKSAAVTVSVANTTLTDAPTNTILLLTAGAQGSIVYGLTAEARATIADAKLQLFRSADAGVTKRFMRSRRMSAYTMANDTAQTETDFGFSETIPLRLQAGDSLYVGASVVPGGAAGIVFDVQYEDL
jgi:hypothetical protein